MGRIIPAGTGLGAYKRLTVDVDISEADEMPVRQTREQPREVRDVETIDDAADAGF
jgi:hypothetical protein